jgi:hypothetical protein
MTMKHSAVALVERPVVGINLFCLAAPGADVDAPRIQNKRGFDGGGDATKASRLVNSNQRGQAQNFPAAAGANDPVFFD